MLTITYDPVNGKTIPDELVKDWTDKIVKDYKEVININITVGSGVMIDATRVLIMKGKLDHREVVYRFRGLDLGVDRNGRLPVWPEGFCNVYDDILEELLQIEDNIVRK